MAKSYPGITDPQDYARFCDLHSFDPDSPYIRKYYKKTVSDLIKHKNRTELNFHFSRSAPVFAIGLTSAIELAVQHVSSNTGYSSVENHRCVICSMDFSGQRICPHCGNHVFCVSVNHDS